MACLRIYSYHYVRDVAGTTFSRLNALSVDAFRRQLTYLDSNFEIAPLETCLAFLNGQYTPRHDLCLLTFDDGFRDHLNYVAPLLAEYEVQGVFHLITESAENRWLAPVHMNHFLMAYLGPSNYRDIFVATLRELRPDFREPAFDRAEALRTYCYDAPDTACFKYLFNFLLDDSVRDPVVHTVFERTLGRPRDFADTLYLTWEDARRMQEMGMVIGGHTRWHRPLKAIPPTVRSEDLAQSIDLLRRRLKAQFHWPFSYPYGKRDSYTASSGVELRRFGYSCGFTMEAGVNEPGCGLYALRRIDCKELGTPTTVSVCAGSLH